ncbi:MAG: transposase [Chloroflexi bacterium]|nr:transposase [Chloroflexota bacterium]
MNIVERGEAFARHLRELANRSAWDWRRCPKCGRNDDTVRNGGRWVYPWTLDGRKAVRIQRHWCYRCESSYSEESALLVRGSWYARDVHRFAVDQWQHVGSSLRRTAEHVRSLLARQERWLLWRPLDEEPQGEEKCHLGQATVQRWLVRAGTQARKSVPGQLGGVAASGQMAADGLWARLVKGKRRVVLLLVDTVTGVVWPPVKASGEDNELQWGRLFRRANLAGLDLEGLRGVTSDGARGLIGYLNRVLFWVNHQRCAFHLWRNLSGELSTRVNEAATGLAGAAAWAVKKRVRAELVALIRGVLDARSEGEAQAALAALKARELGGNLARLIDEHLDAAMVYLLEYNRGLVRVSPEWYWRDFRLRLSRGRNHGSEERLERAALVWAIYRNFTPAQERSERKRHYRHPGLSPLAVAGAPPGQATYLDALAV